MVQNISEKILYIGVDDRDIDLFEGQYIVPNGMCYNSYIILDEKIAVMDSVDNSKLDEWFSLLRSGLNGRTPDYLVVTHMEPDHSAGIQKFIEAYPSAKIVGNSKTFAMISQFFDIDNLEDRLHTIKEGDELSLGEHKLTFVMAPMVHWPEAFVAYESHSKTLFSADAFGKFGAYDTEEEWACEARRYYFNIVGKYGANVQMLLKKLSGIEVNTIAPLHGSILREDLGYYINLYNTWSSYGVESDGVFIAYASIYGNTAEVAHKLQEMLKERGVEEVVICDLARDDMAEALESAFEQRTTIFAAASYDAGVFPAMETFLHHLKGKNWQRRRVGIIENGSWAPSAAKAMKGILEGCKELSILEPVVTIRSKYKPSDQEALSRLADAIVE